MIWPSTASKLALTKLKTRRVRLFITLFISSILFAVILGASLVTRGAVSGVEKFSKSGFGSRYLASAATNSQPYNYVQNPKLIAQAEDLQKQLQAKKKTEAKRLDLTYDSASDQPLVSSYDTPQGKQKSINPQDPNGQKLLADFSETQPGTYDDFKKAAADYGAKATYQSVSLMGFSGPPYLKVLKDGAEDYSQQANFGPPSSSGLDSLTTQWQLMSGSLLQPFLLHGQDLKVDKDGSVPIIAPYSAAEQVLGLKSLPSSASSKSQLARLKQVRAQAAGYVFSVCYRNSQSASDLQNALQQQQQIASQKGQKDFVMPDLVHSEPAKACGAPAVTRDVRTASEKTQAANQQKFDQEFGQDPAYSSIVKFRIVGLNADMSSNSAISANQIFQNVLVSTLGPGWFTPMELASSQPDISKIFNAGSPLSQGSYFAEFRSGDALKKFIDKQNCQPDFSKPPAPGEDPFTQCIKKGKYFSVSPFGSSSTALNDIKSGFSKVFTIAALAVAGLAALIMMGTVGRIIADSRRETAVFRALGAKRFDIAEIYIGYVLMVGLLVFLISLALALIGSSFVNHRYSGIVTVDALLAFNVSDLSQKIILSKLYIKDVAFVFGLILAGSVLAAMLPIVLNLRRNPIRDMRDER